MAEGEDGGGLKFKVFRTFKTVDGVRWRVGCFGILSDALCMLLCVRLILATLMMGRLSIVCPSVQGCQRAGCSSVVVRRS